MQPDPPIKHLLTLFINSTDYYGDAWEPFFRLLDAYWADRQCAAILNTESEKPSWMPENCRVHNNGCRGGKKSWPECMLSGLEAVTTPFVLYVQEDYFLNRKVNVAKLEEMVGILMSGEADVVKCREVGVDGNYIKTSHHGWLQVSRNHGYYASLQAALWRKDALAALVRSGETAWEFERHGTKRARKLLKAVYTPDPEVHGSWDSGSFPYEPTGIISGKWYRPAVEDLFGQNGIQVDFSKRGFYEPTTWQRFKQSQRSRLRRLFMRF